MNIYTYIHIYLSPLSVPAFTFKALMVNYFNAEQNTFVIITLKYNNLQL